MSGGKGEDEVRGKCEGEGKGKEKHRQVSDYFRLMQHRLRGKTGERCLERTRSKIAAVFLVCKSLLVVFTSTFLCQKN